ncbi:hypothetical protein [Streptomyces sioyaensis]|uniref:hypothetical protein n=1 Tax=Streptomyces sioyaensis TaxID=67364 RepID=UPI00100EA753|nr:hypothetical protein [Streptomyces sioyaensis]
MKVRFTGAASHNEGITQGASSLETGIEYQVLEIYTQSEGPNFIRIESIPGQLPGLFDSRLFHVTQSEIPINWRTFIGTNGGISIRPALWHAPGFWESLMDGEEWAVGCYHDEKEKIEST